MRKLWFDLRESIGQAEKVIAGHRPGRTSAPWLVLDVRAARLWFTPLNAPRSRRVAVAATHIDGPSPADEPWPLYRQPLTWPDTDGDRVIDQMRASVEQGHRWLVADFSTSAPWLHHAAAYDTDTLPETAVWTPAWLAAGDLGPYPGQIAHGYQHHGAVIARFTRETVQRIAADARAIRSPERDADLLVLRDYGSGTEVFVVRAAGTPTGGLAHLGESSAVGMRHITADPDGWYRITDDRWPWRHTAPTVAPSRRHREHHEREPEVFEPDGVGGSRCTVCGAAGYDIAYRELPSMAGYGTDRTTWCRICRSSESYAEEIGWSSRRAMWPPVLAPAPAADGEVTRR